MRQFLLGILIFSLMTIGYIALPTSVMAAGSAQGFVVDTDGNGINGATVRAIVTREECPDEGECSTRVTTPTVNTGNHPDTKEPGFFQFRDPEEGSGMIDCRSEFRLEIRLPGTSNFVPYAGAETNTKVLGITSSVLAQGTTQNPYKPGDPVPGSCRVLPGHGKVPGGVVGNVASEGSQNYIIECPKKPDEPKKTDEPKACSGNCNLTDNNACQGAGGQSCVCVDQGDNKGVCQTCPSDKPYNPDTNKCEPVKACAGDCTLTDTTACQAAGGQSCVCVDQGGNKGTCQVCPEGTVYNTITKKCGPPATTPPACNGACDLTSSTACQAGGQACECIQQANGTGACQVCPTGTTYNPETKTCLPPPACNVSCVSDTYCATAKDGCTACLPNSAGGKTCQKPFSENMCQCDSIEIAGKIVPGQKATFTAYAKVSGPDQSIAQVQSLAFHVAQDNKVIHDSSPVAVTVVSKDATMTRYKATFSYTFPANIDPKSIYRVYVDSPKCSQKTAMVIEKDTAVLAAEGVACVDNRNAWEKLQDMLGSWITGDSSDPCASVTTTDPNRANSQEGAAGVAPSLSGATNLQLQTFGDATVTDKSCRFVFFRFQQ